MRDIPKNQAPKKTMPFDGVSSEEAERIEKELAVPIRHAIKLIPLETLPKNLKIKWQTHRGKKIRYSRVLGAAGESLIPEQKLKVMSDPYQIETRRSFTDLALTDPIIAPALAYRVGALFEGGFDLELVSAEEQKPLMLEAAPESQNPTEVQPSDQPSVAPNDATGTETPQEEQPEAEPTQDGALPEETLEPTGKYQLLLNQLKTWKDDKKIERLAKDLEGVSVTQGKAAALISPGIMDLAPGSLPDLVEIITADDLAEPIIDVGLTRKLVACKLNLEDKQVARADELVYLTRGMRGLRREAPFHGTSLFEPILQISKALKRYYNLDAPLAMISAYMTRHLLKIKQSDVAGDDLTTRITTFMSTIFKHGTWAVAMPEWYDGIDTVVPTVDMPMFDGIENKLAIVALNQIGVPKTSQNREQQVNRDTATIQAIHFVRFIRNPSEKDIKEPLENQLFNPLLAHLAGTTLDEMPFRVKIVRRIPEGGDIDSIFDKLAEKKSNEISLGSIIQPDAQSPFGASGADDSLKEQIREIAVGLASLRQDLESSTIELMESKKNAFDNISEAAQRILRKK